MAASTTLYFILFYFIIFHFGFWMGRQTERQPFGHLLISFNPPTLHDAATTPWLHRQHFILFYFFIFYFGFRWVDRPRDSHLAISQLVFTHPHCMMQP